MFPQSLLNVAKFYYFQTSKRAATIEMICKVVLMEV